MRDVDHIVRGCALIILIARNQQRAEVSITAAAEKPGGVYLGGDGFYIVGRELCAKQIRAEVIDRGDATKPVWQKDIPVELRLFAALVLAGAGLWLGDDDSEVFGDDVLLVPDGAVLSVLCPPSPAV
jgi:hypothetical protein